MDSNKEQLNTLKDIKQMMEKSSRFISLSGWSGVAAGICALAGACFAYSAMHINVIGRTFTFPKHYAEGRAITLGDLISNQLLLIAILTFVAAFVSAFIFTYLRSRRNNTPVWSNTSRRLLINASIPMLAGGIYLMRLIENGTYGLIAPGCLIFYGLALINGSKYTLGEIRYLGYCEIILGLINCWFVGSGLYFWAAGFGVLHIIYGVVMWNKYERNAGA